MTESTKPCSRCGQVKPAREFYPDRRARDRLASHCRQCNQEYKQRQREEDPELVRELRRAAENKRYAANPEKARRNKRDKTRKIRKIVLDHYGHACACCGRTTQLTIDHVNGDGANHRKEFNWHDGFYYWLRDNEFPPGFQTLCQPCNRSKGTGSHCRLLHERIPSGLGWPSDDGITCYSSKLLGIRPRRPS